MTVTETQTEEATTGNVPAIRSDSVCQYLLNMAAVLSSIVVDINAQVASIKRISQTNNTEESSTNDNNKQEG